MKDNTGKVKSASKAYARKTSALSGCSICHDIGQVDMVTCIRSEAHSMEFTQTRKLCPSCGGMDSPPPLTGGVTPQHSPHVKNRTI